MSTPIVYFREPGQFKATNINPMVTPIVGISSGAANILSNFSYKLFDLNNSWLTDKYVCPLSLNGKNQRFIIENVSLFQTSPSYGAGSYTFKVEIRKNGLVIGTSSPSYVGYIYNTSALSKVDAYLGSYYFDAILSTNDIITYTCFLSNSIASNNVTLKQGAIVSNTIL